MKVLSNSTVRVPVSVFPVVVSSLPTFHTGSAEIHEFAGEGKSIVSILNKLDNFLARKMRQAGMYQEITVALVERVYFIKGEEAEIRLVVFSAEQR